MTTSGTYAFSPNLGELVLYSYSRCGIRRTALLQEHMADARMAANMVLADFSNRGVDLWQVELVTIPLIEGQSTYNLDPNTVVILDGYIRTTNSGVTTDRYILPVSRTEYSSYPNKQQQGPSNVYWMDRLLAPTVTLWPVPNGEQTSFNIYVLRQAQDANFSNGQNVEIPYVWMKAFSDALSVELSVIWAPDRMTMLKGLALESYATAAAQGVEIAQQYISPVVSGYWRP